MGKAKGQRSSRRSAIGEKKGQRKKGCKMAAQAKARDELAERAAAAEADAAEAAEIAAEERAAALAKLKTPQPRPNTAAAEELRRQMIVHKFEKLGSPPEEMWDGPGGTVSKIWAWLELDPKGDRRPLRRTLERHVNGEPLAVHGGGGAPKLTHGESLIATNILERGLAVEQAAYMVTAHRIAKGKGPVSRTAVETGFASVGGVTRARGTRCQGSFDVDGDWAQARVAIFGQIQGQLQSPTVANQRQRRDGTQSAGKIKLEQIAWSDETHVKIVPGDNSSTVERVAPRSPGGTVRAVEDGGEYRAPDARLVTKVLLALIHFLKTGTSFNRPIMAPPVGSRRTGPSSMIMGHIHSQKYLVLPLKYVTHYCSLPT